MMTVGDDDDNDDDDDDDDDVAGASCERPLQASLLSSCVSLLQN